MSGPKHLPLVRRTARLVALQALYALEYARDGLEPALNGVFNLVERPTGDGDGRWIDHLLAAARGREAEPVDPGPFGGDFEARHGRDYRHVFSYADALVRAVVTHQAEIDAALRKAATNWRLERMAAVDRNVLRAAAAEMLMMKPPVPRSVAINEAIEVAKVVGGDESRAFVNGVLDNLPGPDGTLPARRGAPGVRVTVRSKPAAAVPPAEA